MKGVTVGLVVSNFGAIRIAKWAVKSALVVDEPLSMRLYTNNYTPLHTSVKADFVEAVFGSYVRHTLTRANWGDAVTVSGRAVATYAPDESWAVTAPVQTVYGYFICSGIGAEEYLWGERFATPRPLVAGQQLVITPKFSTRSEL